MHSALSPGRLTPHNPYEQCNATVGLALYHYLTKAEPTVLISINILTDRVEDGSSNCILIAHWTERNLRLEETLGRAGKFIPGGDSQIFLLIMV